MSRVLELLACSVDLEERVARWPDGDRTLSPTEAKLLEYLSGVGGRAVERPELLEEVWGYRSGVMSRTVKTTVARLRAKTERDPRAPDHLKTIIGLGYRFAEASAEAIAQARAERPRVPQEGDDHPTRSSLPPRGRPLFGRQNALAAARSAIQSSSLVSLVGVGGVGKTALALELAHRACEDGAWDELLLVDLRRATTAADLLAEVAAALAIRLEPGDIDGAVAALAGALRSRGRFLLLLDGAEQIAAELAHVLPVWLVDCPDLTCVLSSREVLRVVGEVVIPVDPLDEADAVALFVDRLPEGAEGYETGVVRALVEHLDRIPLAIEMAAAWGDLLDADALARRLGSQLEVLQSLRRDRPARHASLRLTIASSWSLLEPADQAGLLQLATFAGGFTIDDAEAVTDGHALVLLRRLRDRSLLQSTQLGDASSVRLFRAVRDFAREQGADVRAEERHGARLARWGEPELLDRLARRGGVEMGALVAARPDLLLAAERAKDRGDRPVLARCAFALAALADLRGPALVSPELFTPLTEGDPALALLARVEAGALWMARGRVRVAEQELAAAGELIEHVPAAAAARALLRIARILGPNAPAEAQAVAMRACALARSAGADDLVAIGTARVAALAHALGDSVAAEEGFDAALPGLRGAGALREEGRTLAALARVHAERGRPLRAQALHEQALSLVREVGDQIGEVNELDALAGLLAERGDLEQAETVWGEALTVVRAAGDRQLEARVAAHAAVGARRAMQGEAARVDLLRALELAREVQDRRTQVLLMGQLGELDLTLGHLPAARASLLRAITGAERLRAADLEGPSRGALGELLAVLGELEQGREQLRRGRELLEGAHRRTDLVELLERHAEVEAAAGDHEAAEGLLQTAAEAGELSQLDGWV